jgi:hypothetical protein
MYDGKSQLLIKNPIDRYLVNSPMLPNLKRDANGSLTIYIQNKSPGADKESNWLPAPDDTVYLVMRLYWPKTEPPSILPWTRPRGGRQAWSSRRTDDVVGSRISCNSENLATSAGTTPGGRFSWFLHA